MKQKMMTHSPFKFLPALLWLLWAVSAKAQTDSLPARALQFSGYAEIFYAWDFNADKSGPLPPNPFFYNYNRHNEVILNLGYLKAAYAAGRLRANLALMAGSYANDNLANEPAGYRYLFEANAGVRIGRRCWLDAGVLPSHIGFESAVGQDNPTLTRSLAAENSPYYEAGARFSWSNDTWTLAAFYLNGWQTIQRRTNAPAFGAQINWKPNERIAFNYSNFLRFNAFSGQRERRLFHNLYGTFQFGRRWQLWLGVDYGDTQRNLPPTLMLPEEAQWTATTAILRWQCTDRWALAARAEYYNDPNAAIIQLYDATSARFRAIGIEGYSLNVDYRLAPNALARLEGRWMRHDSPIFSPLHTERAWVTASLTVGF